MKHGANNTDQILIANLAKSGKSAKDISDQLQIEQDTVESFMPKKSRKKKEQGEKERVESD